jgi:hypothetical protein
MILARVAGEPSMNDPDDIERRLREIEAELGKARAKEPSAAERARRAAQKTGWRNARKARKLRTQGVRAWATTTEVEARSHLVTGGRGGRPRLHGGRHGRDHPAGQAPAEAASLRQHAGEERAHAIQPADHGWRPRRGVPADADAGRALPRHAGAVVGQRNYRHRDASAATRRPLLGRPGGGRVPDHQEAARGGRPRSDNAARREPGRLRQPAHTSGAGSVSP